MTTSLGVAGKRSRCWQPTGGACSSPHIHLEAPCALGALHWSLVSYWWRLRRRVRLTTTPAVSEST